MRSESPDLLSGSAPSPAPPGLTYGCITHGPRWVDYPAWVATIRLGEAQCEGGLNLRDLAPEWVAYHPVLGGAAGTFALKNLVASSPATTHVGVCQYRKFVSNARISRRVAPSYKVMDIVASRDLSAGRLAAVLVPGGRDFLVTRPFAFSNSRKLDDYLGQFARVHNVEDLLRFSAEAVEQQVLDKAEVEHFFGEDVLIAGGVELGIYPAPFWIAAVTAIENITRACVRRYSIARTGYNARGWAFCSERLGSYLLLRHLRQTAGGARRPTDLGWARGNHWAKRFVGQLNLVANDDAPDYAIGA
jgi:hypothetical protein